MEKKLVSLQELITLLGSTTDPIPSIQEDMVMLKDQNAFMQDSLRQMEEMMFRQFGQDRRSENGRVSLGGDRGRG